MRISDIIRKNKDEGIAFLSFSLPYFVYKSSSYLPKNNLPVFSFHSVKPGLLEEQFKYLKENNYDTLDSKSLSEIITRKKKGKRNSVVLTFDDGRKSLWTTAYPLLKKYNFKAISFIVPSIIKEKEAKSPTLEAVWAGKLSLKDIENIESEIPLCNWNEINEMHKSGLVDFQSHSLFHASVFTERTLVDFLNPEFKPSFLNSTLNPLISIDANDALLKNNQYGFPIYKWDSNLTAETRYICNENISSACVEYVKQHGGEEFFKNPNWRKELKSFYTRMEKKYGAGSFQSYEKRKSDIKNDLSRAKSIIEKRLNKTVTHLCLPWYFGNELTVKLAKETGYESIYWGIKNKKSTNFIGDDPFYIKRINDYYIFSLPGKNRISLERQILNKVKNRYY